MSNVLVQFRADESTRDKASLICNDLGIDLQTYMRMCLSRLVKENGVPFSMKKENKGIIAMQKASKIAETYGIADMSLEEINTEIEAVRKTKK